MNKKIEKHIEEQKQGKNEALNSVLNSFIARLEAGEVVAHKELSASLLYWDAKPERVLSEIASQRGISIVKENGFYVLAEEDDLVAYSNYKKLEQRFEIVFFYLFSARFNLCPLN